MPWPVPDRWDPSESHGAVSRVDVWSRGVLQDSVTEIVDGWVNEKWATGIRATLSLDVPDSLQWERWLDLPELELQPYSGMSWGPSEHLLPLGVFPVRPQRRALPGDGRFRITADDRWSRVAAAQLHRPRLAYVGFIGDTVARLITEAGLAWDRIHPVNLTPIRVPRVQVSDGTPTPPVMWDVDRHKIITELCTSIGAEAFFDRAGQAVVQDRATTPGTNLFDGPKGTISSIEPIPGDEAFNVVTVSGNGNGAFATQMVTNPFSPANAYRIGERVYPYSSSDITTQDQAERAAIALLAEKSAPAFGWTIECVPDPSRMPGDLVWVTTKDLGVFAGAVEEVSHPLVGGLQTVKLGAL